MDDGTPISATVIAQDEAHRIGPCLESLSWVDEIIVVDGGSTDDTREIARACGARVLENSWPGFAAQKNYAIDHASHGWVLSLDADERVTDELRREIGALLARGPECDGYLIPRKNIFGGRWMKGRSWSPDHQMRFFRKGSGRFNDRSVHESVEVQGRTGTLRGALEHHSYDDLGDSLRRLARYANLAAADLKRQGVRPGWTHLCLRPPARFLRNFLILGGFRDGVDGLIYAGLDAFYVFAKYARLRELVNKPDA